MSRREAVGWIFLGAGVGTLLFSTIAWGLVQHHLNRRFGR